MSLVNRLFGMVAALAAMFLASSPVHANQMFLSPTFTVTQSGAAALSIPFQVAPGIAGMQPTVGLAYNSQNPNGFVGVGWNIIGLSAMTRCPATVGQDGARVMAGINALTDSRYCLDGQRLVLVSGTYGADGSEYRLEIDDQTRVIAYGDYFGMGPEYFKAWRKSGEVVEYGKDLTSRIHTYDPQAAYAQFNAVPIIWYQNRVEDRNSNYMSWRYSADYSTHEWQLNEINYTGNVNAGLAPQNKVVFSYGARPESVVHYHNGYSVKVAHRLTQVQMLQGGSAFLTYSLSYGSGQESKLMSVQGCSAGGTVTCWPALQFGWGAAPTLGTMGVSAELDPGVEAGRQWADVNGDGIADFCRIVGGTGTFQAWCTLGTISGTLSGTIFKTAYLDPGYPAGRAFVDVNGDGLADFCRIVGNPGSQQLACTLGTGSGWGSTITSSVIPDVTDGSWVDFDGDGRADFCRTTGADSSSNGRVVCVPSTGTGFGTTVTSDVMTIGDGMRTFTDINGDGFADFCRLKVVSGSTEPYALYCNRGNGSTFLAKTIKTYSTSDWGMDAGRQWADVNGDGLPDFCRVIQYTTTQARLACSIAAGDGNFLVAVTSDIIDPGAPEGRMWVDLNGDGLADFCRTTTGSTYGQLSCTLSTGYGFGATITFPAMDLGYFNSVRVWRDVGAGGGSGYCGLVGNGANQIACTPITTGDRRIVTVSTQGVSTPTHTIAYASLTSGIHTRDTGAAYPLIDAQIPLQVVSQVQVSDGTGGVRTSNYSYGGLRLELNTGRGTQGFHRQTVADVESSIVTETIYFQGYPFTGMPSAVTRKLNGATLAESDSWYSYRSFTGATQDGTASVGTNKRYMLMSDRKLDLTWEIGGVFKGGDSIKQQNIDNYGNVGTVLSEKTDAQGNPIGWSKTATTSFSNDTTNWILGRVLRTNVAASAPNTIPATGVGSDPLAGTVNGTPFKVPYRARPSEIADILTTILIPILTD